ncbi:metallophosphoesterase [Alkalihalobacillus oceani]|uniref:metallophosphoesterase family protein n=1 Tax=Halalkalibacter oceani TaxID=1653776 RepID=UPI00203AF2FE|nr:metallophosphoesterase [Halalkalibacter oceani]
MKLALIGDLHYPDIEADIDGLAEAREVFYKRFIDHFLQVEADLYLSLGDLTNYGHTSELEDIYRLINHHQKDFIHVLGNHDLYAQPREKVLTISGQKRYHSIETDQAILAFLDTAKEMDYEDWGGWLDEAQLDWLEEVVIESGTKPLLVFAHHPVYQTTKRSDHEKGSIHPEIDVWSILEKKRGIGMYFNGHTHIDSIVKKEQWIFVQVSACLDQHALRVIELTPEEIIVSAVDIEDLVMAEAAPVVYRHMNHFTHQTDVRGEAIDRECRVSLLPVVDVS